MKIREGTQVFLYVEQFNQTQLDVNSRMSPLMTVTGNKNPYGDFCLSTGEFRSTGTLTSSPATPILVTSTITTSITALPQSTKNVT